MSTFLLHVHVHAAETWIFSMGIGMQHGQEHFSSAEELAEVSES
jgi:hypothetical protein